jgi:hypothetical protein
VLSIHDDNVFANVHTHEHRHTHPDERIRVHLDATGQKRARRYVDVVSEDTVMRDNSVRVHNAIVTYPGSASHNSAGHNLIALAQRDRRLDCCMGMHDIGQGVPRGLDPSVYVGAERMTRNSANAVHGKADPVSAQLLQSIKWSKNRDAEDLHTLVNAVIKDTSDLQDLLLTDDINAHFGMSAASHND